MARRWGRRNAGSSEPTGVAKDPDSPIARLDAELATLEAEAGPIVAGPFLAEVGYEVLYWIPFLAWALERHPGLRERLTVVSRGGTESWYSHLGVGYADLYDHLDQPGLRTLQDAVEDANGGTHRQMTFSAPEVELLDRVIPALGLEPAGRLHPSVMFQAYHRLRKSGRLFADGAPFAHQRFETPAAGGLADRLPGDYAAVRFYFNLSFPDEPGNRRFVEEAVSRIASETEVVLLNPALRFDDHWDFDPAVSDRVHRIDDLMTPRDNLGVQTAAIAGSRAFVGTYGGLSYLPLYLGVPGLALYSDRERFYQHHLDIAHRVARRPGFGRFVAADVADLELTRLVVG